MRSINNSQKNSLMRLRVRVPSQPFDKRFVIAVKNDWTIWKVANRSLTVYKQIFCNEGKIKKMAKDLTVKSVLVDGYYMSKNENVRNMLNCNDQIVCVIINSKSLFSEKDKQIVEQPIINEKQLFIKQGVKKQINGNINYLNIKIKSQTSQNQQLNKIESNKKIIANSNNNINSNEKIIQQNKNIQSNSQQEQQLYNQQKQNLKNSQQQQHQNSQSQEQYSSSQQQIRQSIYVKEDMLNKRFSSQNIQKLKLKKEKMKQKKKLKSIAKKMRKQQHLKNIQQDNLMKQEDFINVKKQKVINKQQVDDKSEQKNSQNNNRSNNINNQTNQQNQRMQIQSNINQSRIKKLSNPQLKQNKKINHQNTIQIQFNTQKSNPNASINNSSQANNNFNRNNLNIQKTNSKQKIKLNLQSPNTFKKDKNDLMQDKNKIKKDTYNKPTKQKSIQDLRLNKDLSQAKAQQKNKLMTIPISNKIASPHIGPNLKAPSPKTNSPKVTFFKQISKQQNKSPSSFLANRKISQDFSLNKKDEIIPLNLDTQTTSKEKKAEIVKANSKQKQKDKQAINSKDQIKKKRIVVQQSSQQEQLGKGSPHKHTNQSSQLQQHLSYYPKFKQMKDIQQQIKKYQIQFSDSQQQ